MNVASHLLEAGVEDLVLDGSGVAVQGVPTSAISLADLDLWTFNANLGDIVNLRLGTTNFNGKLQLYGPNGALVATAQNSTDVLIEYAATNSGTFTVVASASDINGKGPYTLSLAQIPGAVVVSPEIAAPRPEPIASSQQAQREAPPYPDRFRGSASSI